MKSIVTSIAASSLLAAKKKNNPRWAEVSAVLLLTFSLPRPADAQAGTFSPTGGMGDARTVATATLLPNGTVLIAGGDIGNTSLTRAEIYDANVGPCSPTGSMGAARTSHTATLLPASAVRPHGKVLVAGGGSNSGPPAFASAE